MHKLPETRPLCEAMHLRSALSTVSETSPHLAPPRSEAKQQRADPFTSVVPASHWWRQLLAACRLPCCSDWDQILSSASHDMSRFTLHRRQPYSTLPVATRGDYVAKWRKTTIVSAPLLRNRAQSTTSTSRYRCNYRCAVSIAHLLCKVYVVPSSS